MDNKILKFPVEEGSVEFLLQETEKHFSSRPGTKAIVILINENKEEEKVIESLTVKAFKSGNLDNRNLLFMLENVKNSIFNR